MMTSSIPLKMLEGKFEKGKKKKKSGTRCRTTRVHFVANLYSKNTEFAGRLIGVIALLCCCHRFITPLPSNLWGCNTENYALFDTLQRSKKFLASLIFLHSIT